MLYKTTTKLFHGIYQYKIVLVSSYASNFRSGDWDKCLEQIEKSLNISPKNVEEKKYATDLQALLSRLSGLEIRVESPWISLYSNNKTDIDNIAKIDKSRVKYISQPADTVSLDAGTVLMPKMNYDYRVTLGKTTQPNYPFIEWAENSTKCKLTKSCIRDLTKTRSWGGTHFYITGDNNLLLAKMHLGGSISKVERIIKA
jgi:hypothetical protein